ncbi:MAG TPA: 30S ribosomal protein S7 [Candidatus Woesearchaeota archaeon]|nr:30S ribosomal protein S7 [Candidatus Woesearchaeota archaeon]
MAEPRFFNRWGIEGIEVTDAGLKSFITISPKIVPKTDARYAKNRFHKSKISIVERLINRLQVPGHRGKKHKLTSGHATGKMYNTYKSVENAFEIIEQKTGKNPVYVFVKAIENSAPREEIVTIEYGGARYPKAVECSPQRRVDLVLRNLVIGAYNKSFSSRKSLAETLAEEILSAYNQNQAAFAVAKKVELEKQADASR